jgi:hypothetical protein
MANEIVDFILFEDEKSFDLDNGQVDEKYFVNVKWEVAEKNSDVWNRLERLNFLDVANFVDARNFKEVDISSVMVKGSETENTILFEGVGVGLRDTLGVGVGLCDTLAVGVGLRDLLAVGVGLRDLLAVGIGLLDLLAVGVGLRDRDRVGGGLQLLARV